MSDTLRRANTVALTVALRRFAIHFLEMCVAMCVGGAALSFAVFGLAALAGYPNLVAQAPELSILMIAGDFALAMAVYMALRGHAVRHNVEMSGSAVAGAIPLIGALWLDMIPETTFESWLSLAVFVCGPLCLLMLVVMLARSDHYGGQIGASVPVLSSGTGEYTCPMHPEIRLAQPGLCPVCGMTLRRPR
jgi:Heavy metal binding domain